MKLLLLSLALSFAISSNAEDKTTPRQFSGIYPSLAYWNKEGECGTGAVVPWADRLWVITYGPHMPFGSTDKLHEINTDLTKTIRPESVGGTPANRMIHRESNQLLIGPYLINAERKVRVIPPLLMPGRLTGNARHLEDPKNKVYYATMEEGLYEVDVNTLEVTGMIEDGNKEAVKKAKMAHPATVVSHLPGYHGKGLYSGQGRLIYANNGELSKDAQINPNIPSGALGEWRKPGEEWQLVRRNQFTEVTGPGGIYGSAKPESDPVWSIGWDHRSLILMLLDGGAWHSFRLPKASHCYDGAHGWNTEWPRIRDIGEESLLMTMHGTFWKFPKTFSLANSAGISPRSTYLKVIGDFCRWQDRIVLGCDDTAKSEFLNKRKAKGALATPDISNSNLWFIDPAMLDHIGPVTGSGAVWSDDAVKAGEPSDAYLFSGYTHRAVHLAHEANEAVTFTFEVDRAGNGHWEKLCEQPVPASGSAWLSFTPEQKGAWVRVKTDHDCAKATAFFTGSNEDARTTQPDAIFAGLAPADAKNYLAGNIHSGGKDFPILEIAAATVKDGVVSKEAAYEIRGDLVIQEAVQPNTLEAFKKKTPVPSGILSTDEASVIYTDDKGKRFRLPKGDHAAIDEAGAVPLRICREVCTERDTFQASGSFYELPAENAGGFIKIRPISSHPYRITDYGSWRGMLVLTGINPEAPDSDHIIKSKDGESAVWLGAADDLWKLGKAHGHGGPWKNSAVKAGEASDPYLMSNYEKKTLTLSHDSQSTVEFTIEVDFLANGQWHTYKTLTVPQGKTLTHEFPIGYNAHWVRVKSSADTKATAQFEYQ